MPSSVQQTFVGRENGTDTKKTAARRLLHVTNEGKTGNGLIQERTLKAKGFDNGLTSQTTLHHSFQRKIQIDHLQLRA